MPATRTFPIFPLAQVLLVPGSLLPLHVFEPRYRQLVADALAGDRTFALAMPLERGDGDDPGRPRVHPVVGLGRIVHHVLHPDGRSDVVLAGLARMRIEHELTTGKLYRVVVAHEVPDVVTEGASVAAAARALLDGIPDLTDEERRQIETLPPGGIVDAVLLRLRIPVREKHRIHVQPDVGRRLAEVRRLLSWAAGVRYPADFGPGDPRLN